MAIGCYAQTRVVLLPSRGENCRWLVPDHKSRRFVFLEGKNLLGDCVGDCSEVAAYLKETLERPLEETLRYRALKRGTIEYAATRDELWLEKFQRAAIQILGSDSERPSVEIDMSTGARGMYWSHYLTVSTFPGTTVDEILEVLSQVGFPRLSFLMPPPKSTCEVLGRMLPTFLRHLDVCFGEDSNHLSEVVTMVLKASDMVESLKMNVTVRGSIEPKLVQSLFEGLQSNYSLKTLTLSESDPFTRNDGIPDEFLCCFIQSLHGKSKLEHLDLAGNQCGFETLCSLSDLLNQEINPSCRLTTIDLSHQKGDSSLSHESAVSGLERLSSSLSLNGTVKKLYLQEGFKGSGSIGSLFSHLGAWNSLEVLNVSNNSTDAAGISALGSALRHNSTLRVLKAKNLLVDDLAAWGVFMSALEENSCLQSLDISLNRMDTTSFSVLGNSLTKNCTLENLAIDSCGMTNEDVSTFASKIPRMTHLRSLSINSNYFNEEGGKAVLEGIKGNSSLWSLEMSEGEGLFLPGRVQMVLGKYAASLSEAWVFLRYNFVHHQILNSRSISGELLPLLLDHRTLCEGGYCHKGKYHRPDDMEYQYYRPLWREDHEHDDLICFEIPLYPYNAHLLFSLLRHNQSLQNSVISAYASSEDIRWVRHTKTNPRSSEQSHLG
jgi:Ran GTPase-activating protein (RanGAP) involved in mRNA processing and transport